MEWDGTGRYDMECSEVGRDGMHVERDVADARVSHQAPRSDWRGLCCALSLWLAAVVVVLAAVPAAAAATHVAVSFL